MAGRSLAGSMAGPVFVPRSKKPCKRSETVELGALADLFARRAPPGSEAAVTSDPIWRIDAQGQVTVDASARKATGWVGSWRLISSSPTLLLLSREAEDGEPPSARVALAGDIDATG